MITKNKIFSLYCFFIVICNINTALPSDHEDQVGASPRKFMSAIDFSSDSISFISYVSRACYNDSFSNIHQGLGVINQKTNFSFKEEKYCTKWYFYEKYNDNLDQIGSIVYRPSKNEIVVGFRGSVYDKDWERNLQLDMLEEGNVRIHRGFKQRYQDIVSRENDGQVLNGMLHNILQVIDSENIDIHQTQMILTGHSAGAALATVTAFSLIRSSYFNLAENQICLVTFSSPRVGNDHFAKELERSLGILNVLRFTCSSDTVPHVPLESSGYKHAGIEIPITLTEIAFDDDSNPERSFNYVRSSPIYKFISYSVCILRSDVTSVLLPLTAASFLLTHSMPSDSLMIEALQYARGRYHAGDCAIREIGYVPPISDRRKWFIF